MATRQTYLGNVILAGAGAYLPIDGRWLEKVSADAATHRWTSPATARAVRVKLDAAPGIGNSWTVSVLIDGVDELAVTISGTDTEGVTEGTAAISEDALVCVRYTANGSSPPAVRAHIAVVVDYAGAVSCYGGGGAFVGDGSNTGAFSSSSSWPIVGYVFNRNLAAVDCTIERFVCDLNESVAAGETITLDIRINDTLQSIDLTLDDTNPSANGVDLSLAIAAGDFVSINAHASYSLNAFLRFGIRVAAADGVSLMCSYGTSQLSTPNQARYATPTQGGGDTTTTESPKTAICALSSLQVRDFYAYLQQLGSAVDPVDINVRLNGGTTALALTVPQNTLRSNVADVVTVGIVDLFGIQYTPGDDSSLALLSWGAVQYALAADEEEEEEDEIDDIAGVIGPLIWVECRRTVGAGDGIGGGEEGGGEEGGGEEGGGEEGGGAGASEPETEFDYYVATDGDDEDTGTDIEHPFRTITHALEVASAALAGSGKSIGVRGGLYDEAIVDPTSAGTSWTNKIRVKNYDGQTVTLKPTSGSRIIELTGAHQYLEFDGINLDGSNVTDASIWLDGVDHIRFKNADVHHREGIGNTNAAIVAGGDYCELSNLSVHGTGGPYGVYVSGNYNLIEDCDLYELSSLGVHIYKSGGTPTGNIVRRNRVRSIHESYFFGAPDSRIGGILIAGDSNEVYNNLIYDIGLGAHAESYGGVYVYSGSGNLVANNSIYDIQSHGILLDSFTGTVDSAIVKNNIIRLITGSDVVDGGTASVIANNLASSTDPLFQSPATGDFRLQAGSPAIDAGTTIASITTDFRGRPRPQGAAYDCGAHEGVL